MEDLLHRGGASPRKLFGLVVAGVSFVSIGVLLAFAMVGPERIDPRQVAWLSGDFAVIQFGWWGYRFDPASAWPLTSTRISWPLPIAAAMFDIVPIVALPLKLLSPFLPAEFQYFGALFAFNAALQGLFAFLLFFEIARRAPSAGGVMRLTLAGAAALFLVASPTLYYRFAANHPALTAHWLIIAALWLYARGDRSSPVSVIVGFGALLFLGGGINPYLLAMTSGIYLAFLLRLIWRGFWSWRGLMGSAAPFIAGFASLCVFGFMPIGGEGVIPGGGYGLYSANLLSPIDPMRFPGAALLPAQIVRSSWQAEGYGYLGFGALLLIAVAFVVALICRRISARFTLPLLTVACGAFALALSTTVTLGPDAIAQVALPHVLMNILEIFRSSGRFIWVTDYILVTVAGALIIRLLPPPAALGVLAGCLLVQAVDLAPTFRALRDHIAAAKPVRFTDEAFADLTRAHDRLIVVPPGECQPSDAPQYPFEMLERTNALVMANALETNNFHSGRMPRDQQRYHCEEFLAEFPRTPPNRRTAYLFTEQGFANLGATVLRTHSCDLAENMVFCRSDRGEAGLTARAATAFGDLTGREDELLRPARSPLWGEVSQGFAHEGDALRMIEPAARIDLMSLLPADAPLRVEITMSRGSYSDRPAALDVYVNNLWLGSLAGSSEALRGAFSLPAGLAGEGRLTLALEDASQKAIRVALEVLIRP